ncbi:hypothetical protein ADT27_10260 [Xanthomonas oryzae]|uniref:hypothetical protein n=1 Tax=Xanthomonas oryzae TaxID=347 RepID=UPI0006ABEDFB|nr:hypothetical protein [Xanthomonas oryzae]KOR46433.1 hypothetical protein ADT27_10260 [Xanthomonas oryzae]
MVDEESVKKHGGKRPGAGRPKGTSKKPAPVEDTGMSMLELLRQIALGHIDASPNQLRAAIAACGFETAKPGEIGKKEAAQMEAEEISQAFPTTSPPNLRSVS